MNHLPPSQALSARCHRVINDRELGAILQPRPRAGGLRLDPATARVRVGGSRVLGPWGSSFPLPCRLRRLQPAGYACPLNQESQLQHRRPFLIRNPGGCLDPKRKPTGRLGLLSPTSSLRETEADWGPRLQVLGGARASRPGSVPRGPMHPSPCRRSSKGLTHRRPQPEVTPKPLTTALRRPP